MTELLGLFLDIIIVGLLGATIFFSMRLYNSLGSFRAHRDEFDQVITKLISSTAQAEDAIRNMKAKGAEEYEELETLIKRARDMQDELKIVNEACENMAKRLETLAEKNSKIAQGVETNTQRTKVQATPPPANTVKPSVPSGASSAPSAAPSIAAEGGQDTLNDDFDLPAFMIQDKEFDEFLNDGARADTAHHKTHPGFVDVFDSEEENYFGIDEGEESPIPHALQSQAERELFSALQKNKRKAANGGHN